VLTIFILAILHLTKIANVGRSLEFGREEQHSGGISAQKTPDSIMTVKASKHKAIGNGIGHDQQEANNQSNSSTSSSNTHFLKVCLSQWINEVITFEEAMRCMDDDPKQAT